MNIERRGGMILTGENRRTRRKSVTVPFSPLHIPRGLTRARTQASTVRQRVTPYRGARMFRTDNE
jgi:hypothetical protein